MRHCQYRRWCETLAVVVIGSVATMTSLYGQEFIGNQPVVSDHAITGAVPGAVISEGSPIGGTTTEGSSIVEGCVAGSQGEYVGDLSTEDAGLGSGDGMQRRQFGQPDLFYNYFTQGYSNQANAQMYLSPLPIPPNVGHTFYTYQPFYPHHMLYWHKDRYHRYYDNGRGMNRTRALYYAPPVKTAVSNFYWNYLRLPR